MSSSKGQSERIGHKLISQVWLGDHCSYTGTLLRGQGADSHKSIKSVFSVWPLSLIFYLKTEGNAS